jgi:hypothetical protein
MNLRRTLSLIGLALLLIGLLTPISSEPNFDNYFAETRLDNSLWNMLLVLIVGTTALALKKDEVLWVIGLISLGILVNDFRIVARQVSDSDGASLSWGWLVLFNGAAFMTLTVLLGEDRERLATLPGLSGVRNFIASLDPQAPLRIEDDEESEENKEIGDVEESELDEDDEESIPDEL